MSRANSGALLALASFLLCQSWSAQGQESVPSPPSAQTETAAVWIKKAKKCIYDGDDLGAYQACTMAIKLAPKNVEAWNLRGDTNMVPWALAFSSRAHRDYSQALTLDPKNCHALTYRGYLAYGDPTMSPKEDLESAIRILKAIPNRTLEEEKLHALAAFLLDQKSALPLLKRVSDLYPTDTELLMRLGAALDTAGRGEEAKAVFKKDQELLLAELPTHFSSSDSRQLMRTCSTLRNYSSVIKVLTNHLKKQPNSVHAVYVRAYLYSQANKPKAALKDYERATELGPRYQARLTAYGDFEVAHKNYRNAARIYGQAIANDPNSQHNIVKRALALSELNMRELAIKELNLYLSKDPDAFQIWRARANIEKKGNPEQARHDHDRCLELLSQKIKATPDLYKLYSLRSSVYLDFEQTKEALADLDQAIRLKPDDPNLYNIRAHLKWNYLNLKAEAIADVLRAVDCAPYYTKRAYLMVLSLYYKGTQEYDKALATADDCIALNPEDPDAYQLKAACYTAQGRFPDALAVLEKCSALGVEDSNLDLQRAKIYVSQNRTKDALTAFSTSLSNQPDNLEALLGRGVLHTRMEQYDLALIDFKKALNIDPKKSDTYLSRARTYAGKGEYLKAAADMTEAMRLSNQTNASWLLEDRARFYTYAEHYKEAASDLSRAYKNALNKPLYLYQCGKLLYWSGNKLGAIDSITHYLKLVPDLRALRARARCYFETNQFEKSIQDYSSLIQGDPENPVLYRLRAKSYSKSGNQQLASADMKKADSLMKSR